MEYSMPKPASKKTNWKLIDSMLVVILAVVIATVTLMAMNNKKSSPSSSPAPAAVSLSQAPTPASSGSNSGSSSGTSSSANVLTLTNNSPAASSQPAANLSQSYTNTTLGYTIKYPSDWIYSLQSDGSMTFSGPDNTPAYNSTVSIESQTGSNLASVISNLKSDYTSDTTANAKITNDMPQAAYTMPDGTTINAALFQVDYTDNSSGSPIASRDLVVVVPKGNQYLVWTYSSPVSQFDTYWNVAQGMFGSWVIAK